MATTPPPEASGCATTLSGRGALLLEGLTLPRRLAHEGEHLYVSEAGPLAQSRGRLLRLPLFGGEPQVLLEGLRAPDALVVRGGTVFFVDDEGVKRLDPGAAGARLLDATVNNALRGGTTLLLSGDTLVFATNHRALVQVRVDGKKRLVLHQVPVESTVRGATLSGADVLFLVAGGEQAGLYRVPLAGGAPAQLLDATLQDGLSLHALAEGLLFTGAGGQLVLRTPVGDELLATGLREPVRPVLHRGVVYVPTSTAGSGPQLGFTQAVARCAPGLLWAIGPEGQGPGEVLSVQDALYFTSSASGGQGALLRLP
jgi:hypothetical protein